MRAAVLVDIMPLIGESLGIGLRGRGAIRRRSRHDAPRGLNDRRSPDPVTLEEFLRWAAARDLADRQPVHVDAGVADGLEHGGSQPALCVMVLDGQGAYRRGVRGR